MKQSINKTISGKVILPLLVFALVVVSTSCGSKKTVASTSGPTVSSSVLKSDKDVAQQLSSVVNSYGSWQKLRMPVTVELAKPKKITISGTVIMERDKSLMIMLKYFGFEVGSLYLTADSITVIDKIHKSYAKENIHKFLGGFNVTVANVQDLLLGRIFALGKSTASVADFSNSEKERVSDSEWLLIPTKASGVEYGFRFSPIDVLSALICQTGSNPPVTCVYATAVNTPVGPMSPEITVSYEKGKTTVDASLQWSLSKAKWNEDVDLRIPSIGKDYKRISSADISKIVSKL